MASVKGLTWSGATALREALKALGLKATSTRDGWSAYAVVIEGGA